MSAIEYLDTVNVPLLSIIFMNVSAAAALLLPVVLFIIFRKKTGARVLPLFAGAASFITFAMILEPLFLGLIPLDSLIGVYPRPAGNIAAYTAIVCLTAGIFEETGRFITIKWLLKSNNSRLDTPLAYGVGHGGIESILVAGLPIITLIASSVYLNNGTMRGILSKLSEEDANTQAVALLEVVQENSVMFLAGGVERIAAITFHICASVLVWMAVTKPGKIWLYPAAILAHAALNIPAALYQVGVLDNIWMIESLICGFAAVFAAVLIFKLRSSRASLPE